MRRRRSGLYLDGEVSAVIGTHTHVQTADERILSGGTAYITDIGMTGPIDSVIGMKKETAIARSLTQMPLKMEVQNSTARSRACSSRSMPTSGQGGAASRGCASFPRCDMAGGKLPPHRAAEEALPRAR